MLFRSIGSCDLRGVFDLILRRNAGGIELKRSYLWLSGSPADFNQSVYVRIGYDVTPALHIASQVKNG